MRNWTKWWFALVVSSVSTAAVIVVAGPLRKDPFAWSPATEKELWLIRSFDAIHRESEWANRDEAKILAERLRNSIDPHAIWRGWPPSVVGEK